MGPTANLRERYGDTPSPLPHAPPPPGSASSASAARPSLSAEMYSKRQTFQINIGGKSRDLNQVGTLDQSPAELSIPAPEDLDNSDVPVAGTVRRKENGTLQGMHTAQFPGSSKPSPLSGKGSQGTLVPVPLGSFAESWLCSSASRISDGNGCGFSPSLLTDVCFLVVLDVLCKFKVPRYYCHLQSEKSQISMSAAQVCFCSQKLSSFHVCGCDGNLEKKGFIWLTILGYSCKKWVSRK